MRFLVIIVILVVLVAAVWLRTARSSSGVARTRPHRLDDSISMSPDADPGPDQPTTDSSIESHPPGT